VIADERAPVRLADSGLPADSLHTPAGMSLSGRLNAVARLVQIGSARSGPDRVSPELLKDAEELLARGGERLRLSGDHTIVVLAGGTGSGKSSLFNRLAGADFSPAGVTRPITRQQHACVWDTEGAGPLLDWLGVQRRYRYARSSALDEGERSLSGLILLDLPDHDSVVAGDSAEVNRLIRLADLMVWVLDPQKYADASVHSRYLMPMSGHSSVIGVVLNQADRLSSEEAEDCAADLRRLLDSEGLQDTRVLLTSALTGAGLDDLRKVLTETVSARQAVAERIGADVDALVARFEPYAEDTNTGPVVAPEALNAAFSRAVGVQGVGSALQSARELRGADYVGWPVSWLAGRIAGRDPMRKLRLGKLWDELRTMSAGPAGAQRSEIDNALTDLANEISPALPQPWSSTVREAIRSRAEQIPAALGSTVGAALPPENEVTPWWRLVAAWQGLLLGSAVVGVAWFALVLAFGVFHAAAHPPALFGGAALLPWVALLIAALLALGWLTAIGCMSVVTRSAKWEREQTEEEMRAGVAEVSASMVVIPARQELSEYARFCSELESARGHA
jgi:GTP-binding protein EngB required for normal cell division